MSEILAPDPVAGAREGLTEALARLVVETADDAFTPEMRARAAEALTDTLACAVAGSRSAVARSSRAVVRAAGGGGQALLWGTGHRVGTADSALLNAIAGHALDYDDSLPVLRGHPSVPLFSAGFAIAATRPVAGRQMLAAFILGLEVAARLGRLLGGEHYRRGWHITATVGVFSTAAMAGRLLGLDVVQMRHAFGLAAADSGGMIRNFGTMAKSVQAGTSARAGVFAVQMAAEGITADASIFEGASGFAQLYAAEGAATAGSTWAILDPGIFVKRWPCCYACHRPLAGLLALVSEHGITPDDVRRIEVGFLPDADKALVHRAPETGLEAKFSIEYCAAAALIDGQVTLDSFSDAAVRRDAVRALMARVDRFAMPGIGSFSGVHGWTDVRIVTARGTFERRVDATPGSPQAPMTGTDRRDKFLSCVAPVLGRDRAEAAFAGLDGFDKAPDAAAALARALEPSG